MDDTQQFEQEKQKSIKNLGENKDLRGLGLEFLRRTGEYKYTYHFNWLGLPIIQVPQDIIALQEIIWKVKPDLIIETGIARGGSLIFYASMLELLGEGEVLGIDIDIRAHNRKKIEEHKMAKRIKMIEGSSTDDAVIEQVEKIVSQHKTVLVCLDSLHTHDHVLKELKLYSSFVTKGSYMVAFDTSIEYMPEDYFPDRPWAKGDNAATAVQAFLVENPNFVVDNEFDNKLLISVAPGGYLKRIS